jgi:hypothetical protein
MPCLGSEPALLPKNTLQERSAHSRISRPWIAASARLPPREGHGEREAAPIVELTNLENACKFVINTIIIAFLNFDIPSPPMIPRTSMPISLGIGSA